MGSLTTLRALALLRQDAQGLTNQPAEAFVVAAILETLDAWAAEGCPGYANGEAEKLPKTLTPTQASILAALSDAVAELNGEGEP